MNQTSGITSSVQQGLHSIGIDPSQGITHSAFNGQQIIQLLQSTITAKASSIINLNSPTTAVSKLLTTGGPAQIGGLLSAIGISTGALEVANDASGGLTQATMGLEANGDFRVVNNATSKIQYQSNSDSLAITLTNSVSINVGSVSLAINSSAISANAGGANLSLNSTAFSVSVGSVALTVNSSGVFANSVQVTFT
jgi:hypothetical protein